MRTGRVMSDGGPDRQAPPPERPGWPTATSRSSDGVTGWPTLPGLPVPHIAPIGPFLPSWPGHTVTTPGDDGAIVLRMRHSWFGRDFDGAMVSIDDQVISSAWRNGTIVITALPGIHTLRVWRLWYGSPLTLDGAADQVFAVAARQAVELEYVPSPWFASRGSLRLDGQPSRRVGLGIIVAALWLVLMLVPTFLG